MPEAINEPLSDGPSCAELLWAALEQLPTAMLITDERRRIFHLNEAATALLGLNRKQALGIELGMALRAFGHDVSERITAMAEAVLRRDIDPGKPQERVIESRAAWRGALEVQVTSLNGARPDKAQGAMILLRDVTAQHSRTNELHYQATHDSLTGLINRFEFQQRLSEFLSHHEHTGVSHALCFIDLDQFKLVNDRFGHSTGDRLLAELSEHLQGHLRKGDVLGRLGGDEFGLILGGCSGRDAVRVGQSIQQAVARFRFDHHEDSFRVGASIGVTDICSASASVQELIDAADSACYAAKQAGTSVVVHSNDGYSAPGTQLPDLNAKAN